MKLIEIKGLIAVIKVRYERIKRNLPTVAVANRINVFFIVY